MFLLVCFRRQRLSAPFERGSAGSPETVRLRFKLGVGAPHEAVLTRAASVSDGWLRRAAVVALNVGFALRQREVLRHAAALPVALGTRDVVRGPFGARRSP